jgi:hypothetical protein
MSEEQYWTSKGCVQIVKDDSEHGEVDSVASLYDSQGVKRLWPAPKCQADVENLCIVHQMHNIDIERVVMAGSDYEVYARHVWANAHHITLTAE